MNRQVRFHRDVADDLVAIRFMIRSSSQSLARLRRTEDAINFVRRRLKTESDQGKNPNPNERDWFRMSDPDEIVALYYTVHDSPLPIVHVDNVILLRIPDP